MKLIKGILLIGILATVGFILYLSYSEFVAKEPGSEDQIEVPTAEEIGSEGIYDPSKQPPLAEVPTEEEPSTGGDVSVAGDGFGNTCENKFFDILIVLDGSGSPEEEGITDDIEQGFDAFIDSVDLDRNRLAVISKRGWGIYANPESTNGVDPATIPYSTGYTNNKENLKASYKQFGYYSDPICNTRRTGDSQGCPTEGEKIPNQIRNFLSGNRRTVNGVQIPTVIITFDDGDDVQLPTLENPEDGGDACVANTGELQKWQALEEFGAMHWVRFTSPQTNTCTSYWSAPGVMTRGNGSLVEFQYGSGASGAQLAQLFTEIYAGTCESLEVTPSLTIEKSGAIGTIDADSGQIAYTLTVTNTSLWEVPNPVVTDTLPTQTDSVVTSSPQGTYNSTDKTLTWALPALTVGASTSLTYTIDIPISQFGQITNTACAYIDTNKNGIGEDAEESACDSETLNLESTNGVIINKTSSSTKVSNGTRVAYTVGVQNVNPTALSNLTVSDTLDSKVQTSWVSGITPSTGSITGTNIRWAGVNLAGGGSASFTYVVTIPTANSGVYTNVVVLLDSNNAELGRSNRTVSTNALPNTAFGDTVNLMLPIGLILVAFGVLIRKKMHKPIQALYETHFNRFEKGVESSIDDIYND